MFGRKPKSGISGVFKTVSHGYEYLVANVYRGGKRYIWRRKTLKEAIEARDILEQKYPAWRYYRLIKRLSY